MKVIHLISSIGIFGAERIVIILSKLLQNKGIEPVIGIFNNKHNPYIELYNIAQRNKINSIIFDCDGKFDHSTLLSIIKFIKNNKITLIHTHNTKANFYGFIASYITKIPIISTCHGWINNRITINTNTGFLRPKFNYYFFDKYFLKYFSKVIAVSNNIKDALLSNKITNVKVIFNGVDMIFESTHKDLRHEFNIDTNKVIIGTVARFTEEKGLSNLLHAAREIIKYYDNVYFMLVGDGPLKNDLINLARSLNIYNKVIFTGQRNDIPEVYNTFDIFILPSLKEGLPMVILEAMASKKPIVASSVGAIPDVIENGKSGLLISPGDVKSLSRAILQLLENPSKRKYLAENAFERVKNNFSAEHMCKQYIKVYQEVLKSYCS